MTGGATFPLAMPAVPGLDAWLQVFTFDLAQPNLGLDATNGLRLRNDY
jgi:hypothetical protein